MFYVGADQKGKKKKKEDFTLKIVTKIKGQGEQA